MTDTATVRDDATPDGSPRDHWTTIHADGGTRWYRHTWTTGDARRGLVDAFLGSDDEDTNGWMGQDMRVVGDDGAAVAVLVHPDRLRRLEAAAEQIERMKDQPVDGRLHPAMHGPHSGGDALLIDTEPIQESLRLRREWAADPARADLIAKDPEMVDMADAVLIAMRTVLPADDDGIVPVRAWSGAAEGATRCRAARWMLAWETSVRGLFVRGDGPVLWGEDYAVICGSGYKLRGGFISREVAADYAKAIAEAVPGIDWRVWTATEDETTPGIMDALKAANARWTSFGPRDDAPVPAGSDQ